MLGAYQEKLDQAAHLIFKREADPTTSEPCSCNRGTRAVKCFECRSLPLLCQDCWLEAHQHNSLHWAHVWSNENGFFVKHDISTLGHSIPLLHSVNEPCTRAKEPQLFIIADVNGVHATKVTFCGCEKGRNMDKWTQLFMLDLFPSTVREPQSAFTFELLRQYEMLVTQAQVTAHQFMKSLRRLTDNVFTGNVPVSCFADIHNVHLTCLRIYTSNSMTYSVSGPSSTLK